MQPRQELVSQRLPRHKDAGSYESMAERWKHADRVVNGVRLHVVEAGDGHPVVLLHGFPEFWYSWRFQIPELVAAGFHVLAPDQRGYNTSEKPHGVRAYGIGSLVGDIAALVESTGAERAHIIGHDWGGIVAWYVAMHRPEVVARLVIVNAPHPAAFRRDWLGAGQWRRSLYMGVFQIPRLPELVLRAAAFAGLARALRAQCRNARAFSEDEFVHYRAALRQPGALTAAIDYYRAAARPFSRSAMRDIRTITAPTLVVWGERDPYLGVSLAQGLDEWVEDVRVERLADAGHWVHLDEPARVNELLVRFLAAK